MVRTEELRRLHSTMGQRIKAVLGYAVTLSPTDASNRWPRFGAGRPVVFDMMSDDLDAEIDSARDDLGHSRPALLLLELEHWERAIWVAWREQWESTGDGCYRLDSLGWTFFHGMARPMSRMVQVLRAEWDLTAPAAPDGADSAGAAQPHWHVDPTLTVDFPKLDQPSTASLRPPLENLAEAVAGGEVAEGEDLAIDDVSLSRLHLGMGGWDNARGGAEGWRRPDPDAGAVAQWAVETVALAKREFQRFAVEESA